MNYLKLIAPVLILVLAVTVPPVIITNVIASSAGLLMISNLATEVVFWEGAENNQPTVSLLNSEGAKQNQLTVIQLTKGYVQFEHLNGKVTSRYFKNSEGAKA